MNIVKYKCPPAISYRIDYDILSLTALSQNQIAAAEQAARIYCVNDYKYLQLEIFIQILAASTKTKADYLREYSHDSIEKAYERWIELQYDCLPDIEELKEYLSWAIYTDNDIVLDGIAIYNTNNPYEYYGKPISELTIGQLIYYLLVKQAYTDKAESGKKATKRWLKKMQAKHTRGKQ